jgi:gluconokinase
MGVSGVGKTTVAVRVAAMLGWPFGEGDDFHPPANVEAMAAGRPLTDADRWPWLDRIGEWLDAQRAADRSVVVTCSALRRAYRERLRGGRPGLWFCELDAPPAQVGERIAARVGHYMPPDLLPSQLAALEPLGPDESGARVAAQGSPEQVAAAVVATFNPPRATGEPATSPDLP